ncbi:Nucleolar protein 16 [Myotis brandtii]|uniref:Nucleolar protein 16 n=1 Tax=Myotis brandtii TaxID=109478 RepID=S7PW46_MYOBR|nr:Nucleolar protein 16 [Myotis brandtii]
MKGYYHNSLSFTTRPRGKTQRQKFGYFLNRNAYEKAALQIECYHIQHAWDHTKSMWQNLVEMGLAMDPNKAVPFRKRKMKAREVNIERPQELVQKPYVLNDLEVLRSQSPRKERKYTVSGPHSLGTLHGEEPRGGI